MGPGQRVPSEPQRGAVGGAIGTDGTFLGRLNGEQRLALESRARLVRLGDGDVLAAEGATSGRVDVILAGHVKASAMTGEGREVVLAVRGPGDVIGEFSAIDGLPHSATTTALGPVEVLAVPASGFRAFLREHPDVMLDLLRTVVARLRDADRKRVEFGSADTVGRVARRLLELADSYGRRVDDGSVEIELPLSQAELAGWVGASREAVTRALRVLRADRAIATGRRSVRILDLDGLRRRGS